MTIIPKLRCKFGENLGVELYIYQPDLDSEFTFLNTDYASGVASFSVDNGLKFSASDYLIFGSVGANKTEVLLVSGAPTATTIATTSNSSFAHSRGEKIQFIPYNQIEIYRSTDGTTYALLTTQDIRVDSTETYYNDVDGLQTYYYKIRFKNSTTSKYSSYSDAIIATGFLDNSAGNVIRKALIQLGESVDSEVITKEFLFEALNEGRREIDEHVGIIRWPFRTKFDYDAGNVIPGTYTFTLPTDLRYPSTNENILSLRIGRNKTPLDCVDKQVLNSYYESVAHTTLNGAVLTGDVTITLTSSGDFDESGSIQIAGQAVNEDIDEIDYTSNNEVTNVISGVTGIRTAGHATGTDVWQNAQFGLPNCYTVDNGQVIFNYPFDDDYSGENIWLDYYKTITDINSDSDLLDEPFYNIYIPWLKWKIKSRKDQSLNNKEDGDYLDWKNKVQEQVVKNYTGQNLTINIDIP